MDNNCNLASCRYNINGKCENEEKRKECIEVSRNVLCLEAKKIKTYTRYDMGYEYEDCYCPSCEEFLCYEPQRKKYSEIQKYCYKCGQKLEW